MNPATSLLNLTPSSCEAPSLAFAVPGTSVVCQIDVQGHAFGTPPATMVTGTLVGVACTLPLSSIARLRIVKARIDGGVQT
jgi:hypothetical protein